MADDQISYSDLLKRVKQTYDKETLIPELGKGNLRERLLGGLERAVEKHKPAYVPAVDKDVVNKEIDYNAIHETKKSLWILTRLRRSLNRQNIVTYGDLAEYVKSHQISVDTYNRRRLGIKGLGKDSENALYKHLKSIGVNLFRSDYTPEELGFYLPVDQTMKRRLRKRGIKSIVQFLQTPESKLLNIAGFDINKIREIKRNLAKQGFSLE